MSNLTGEQQFAVEPSQGPDERRTFIVEVFPQCVYFGSRNVIHTLCGASSKDRHSFCQPSDARTRAALHVVDFEAYRPGNWMGLPTQFLLGCCNCPLCTSGEGSEKEEEDLLTFGHLEEDYSNEDDTAPLQANPCGKFLEGPADCVIQRFFFQLRANVRGASSSTNSCAVLYFPDMLDSQVEPTVFFCCFFVLFVSFLLLLIVFVCLFVVFF